MKIIDMSGGQRQYITIVESQGQCDFSLSKGLRQTNCGKRMRRSKSTLNTQKPAQPKFANVLQTTDVQVL